MKLTSFTRFVANVGVCTNGNFFANCSAGSSFRMSSVTELLRPNERPTSFPSAALSARLRIDGSSVVRRFQPHHEYLSSSGSSRNEMPVIVTSPNAVGSLTFSTALTTFGSSAMRITPLAPWRPMYTRTEPDLRSAAVMAEKSMFVTVVHSASDVDFARSAKPESATLFVAICTSSTAFDCAFS